MSGFSFLNMRDFGTFYAVMDEDQKTIVLVSILVYKMGSEFHGPPIDPVYSTFPASLSLDYQNTAKRSCYGSVI